MTEPTTTQTDRSLSGLFKQLSQQTSELARKEVELAKAELALKGRKAAPERAIENVKEDVQWTKQRAQEARR
jgi:hypothetical protein